MAQQRNKLCGAQGDTPSIGISEDAQHTQLNYETSGDLHGSGRWPDKKEFFRSGHQGSCIMEWQALGWGNAS